MSEHPTGAKPEDPRGRVGQGWACGPEWAAARDHLQLQSDGERAASLAQLALPPTQGLAILCPTPVKHHFVSASPFAFPVILRAVVGVLISPFAYGGIRGAHSFPMSPPPPPRTLLVLRPDCPVPELSTLDPKPGCIPACFVCFLHNDETWVHVPFKAFILIL